MANFKFNAHGNFSGCFGWDSGIDSISVGCQVPSYDHYLWQEVGYSASHNVAEYFQNKYGSGHFYLNEHGGSRNVWGEVESFDSVTARKCLEILAKEKFPVTPYQPDNYDDETPTADTVAEYARHGSLRYIYPLKKDPVRIAFEKYYQSQKKEYSRR